MTGHTAEAVVLTGAAGALLTGAPAPGRGLLRRRVSALIRAGVDIGVVTDVALVDLPAPGLPAPGHTVLGVRPVGPGRLWVAAAGGRVVQHTAEGGTEVVPPGGDVLPAAAGPVGALLALLAADGIGAGLVLVVADPYAAPAALAGQLGRRRARRVPDVDDDPAWTVREGSDDPLRRRVAESICTLGAGGFATRGAVEEPVAGSSPLVLADGVYRARDGEGLLPGPTWTSLAVTPPPRRDERVLDLRTGVLLRRELVESDDGDGRGGAVPMRTVRFVSLTRPGVVALRAEAAGGRLRAGEPLHPATGAPATRGTLAGRHWARTGTNDGPGIVALAVQRTGRDTGHGVRTVTTVERLAAFAADPHRPPALAGAAALLDAAADAGFDRLLAEHRAAWARRWEAVDVRIPDDPATQLGVRFALFQLWCNVDRPGEAAVGARGLSGSGYAGHVFWDADVFVLPAVVAMAPAAARAMVRYRLARLGAARAYAAATGHAGARFPWESAATGADVTPVSGRLGGTVVPILTGPLEQHITADVAWAAARYATWTGAGTPAHPDDPDAGARQRLLVETARYWASRVRAGDDGRVHIDRVIGPDEYHETVDDNAFTNVMARWNLRAGADALAGAGSGEAGRWRELAAGLVDGYDRATGRYEQFAGYFALEPWEIARFAAPPVAADLLLGRERTAASQIIKQPDVLMLHHLVPAEVEPGSLVPNLDFYGPRTAHGSSLSPAVTAALLARAGRPDDALAMLGLALTLDLGDTTGMTAAGLHLANLAGVWTAVLGGFAGVDVVAGVLTVDPQLPRTWSQLEVRFRALGRQVVLAVTPDDVVVRADGPVPVRLGDDSVRLVTAATRLGAPRRPAAGSPRPGRRAPAPTRPVPAAPR